MKKLILRLKTAWNFWVYYPVVVIPDRFWTNEDAKALSNFLTGPVGTKLRNLRWQQLRQAEQKAMLDSSDSAYTKGVAWGIRAYFTWEDSLLQISPTESESQPTTEQDEGLFRSVNR
jgi:hypothetical protein